MGAYGRERLGQQNQESRPHNKHVPRNKERRKQHQGTRNNIPDGPEVINREKDAPHNPHTSRQPHPSKQWTTSDHAPPPCRLTGTTTAGQATRRPH